MNESCTSESALKTLASLNIAMGTVSLCSGVIFLISFVYLKKHHFHTQRLIIYLNVTVVLIGLASVTQVHVFTPSNVSYCTASGFTYFYSQFLQLAAIVWIVLDMFAVTVLHFTPSIKYEVFQVLSSLLVPLIFLWIPFIPSIADYGSTGALCEIEYIDLTTCQTDTEGYAMLLLLHFGPQFVALVLLLALYIATRFRLHREKYRFKGVYHPHDHKDIEDLTKHVRRLQAYPVIYFVFEVFCLVYFIIAANNHGTVSDIFEGFQIFALNLKGVAISLAYVVHGRTCSRMIVCCSNKLFGKKRRTNSLTSAVTYIGSGNYVSFGDSLKRPLQ